jgi:hypothetical protein
MGQVSRNYWATVSPEERRERAGKGRAGANILKAGVHVDNQIAFPIRSEGAEIHISPIGRLIATSATRVSESGT